MCAEQVSSFDDVDRYWAKARENRTTFSNNINEHSSRSHLVLSLHCTGLFTKEAFVCVCVCTYTHAYAYMI